MTGVVIVNSLVSMTGVVIVNGLESVTGVVIVKCLVSVTVVVIVNGLVSVTGLCELVVCKTLRLLYFVCNSRYSWSRWLL